MAGSTNNPVVDVASVINSLAPTIFGKKDATSEQISQLFDPGALGKSNEIFDILKERGSSTAAADGVINDILTRAQQAFAPVLGEEKSAGFYNSAVKQQLAHESIARATAASADAVFKMQQQSLDTAAQIANAQVQNSKTTAKTGTTAQKGQGKNTLLTLGGGLAAGEAYKKIKGMFGGGKDSTADAGGDTEMASLLKDYNVSTGNNAAQQDISAGGGFDPETILAGQPEGADLATSAALNSVASVDGSPSDLEVGLAADADVPVDIPAEAAATPLLDSATTDAGSEVASDVGGSVDTSDFFDDVGNFLGFADGGSVQDRLGYTEESNQTRAGEVVTQNIVEGGRNSIPVVDRIAAPNATPSTSGTEIHKIMEAQLKNLQKVQTGSNSTADSTATNSIDAGPNVGPAPAGIGSVAGIAAALAGINAPIALMTSLLALAANANATADTSLGAAVAADPDAGVAGGPDDPGTPGVDASTGSNAGESPDSGPAGGTDSSGAGDAGSAGGDAGSGGDGGGSAGGDLFDGGLIIGQKPQDFAGVDKVKVNVTPDEYVLPQDVVDIIGKDNLDDFVRKHHRPIAARG